MKEIQRKPLRILSLDGGGVKGLATLLILKRLFRTITDLETLPEMPRPCDYFDIICGTSTGGLIAIMLGRLRMNIEEAIKAFETFSSRVFSERWTNKNKLVKWGNAISGRKTWFRGEDMENSVKEPLRSRGIGQDEPLLDAKNPSCKVFVTATRDKPIHTELLRSYKTTAPTEENYDCAIWEAARATSAASLFFEPITFRKGYATFVDGSLELVNPIYELLREVHRIYDAPTFGCVVSIGTGRLTVKPLNAKKAKVQDLVVTCKDLVVNAHRIAQSFAEDTQGRELSKSNKYFRLDVDRGMDSIGIQEWKKTKDLEGYVMEYLSEKGEDIAACAHNIAYPSASIVSSQKISTAPRDVNANFTGRASYFAEIDRLFKESEPTNQRVLLWGLGGIGKTQIALRYAERVSSLYSMFWIQADSDASIRESTMRIVNTLSSENDPKGKAPQSTATFGEIRQVLEKTKNVPWLLIIDGADDLELFGGDGSTKDSLVELMPWSENGRILLTSREQRIAGMDNGSVVPARNSINVREMSLEEGYELFQRSIPESLHTELGVNDTSILGPHLRLLNGLPLAISQAAAFIRTERMPIGDYIQEFETISHPFLQEKGQRGSVLTTWEISYRKLENTDKTEGKSPTTKLLDLTAMFESHSIPRESLRNAWVKAGCESSFFFSAVGRLLNFSLLEQNSVEKSYSLHPLVHEWALRRLLNDEKTAYLDLVLLELWETFPTFNSSRWPLSGKNILPNICNDAEKIKAVLGLFAHSTRAIQLAPQISPNSRHVGAIALSVSQFYYLVQRPGRAADFARYSFELSQNDGLNAMEKSERELLLAAAYILSDTKRAFPHLKAIVARLDNNYTQEGLRLVVQVKLYLNIAAIRSSRYMDAVLTAVELISLSETLSDDAFPAALRTEARFKLAYALFKSKDPEKIAYANAEAEGVERECKAAGDTESITYLCARFHRVKVVTDPHERVAICKEVLETSIRVYGRTNSESIQFAVATVNHLWIIGGFAEAEAICREFIQEMPTDLFMLQGRALLKWAALLKIYGSLLAKQKKSDIGEFYLLLGIQIHQSLKGSVDFENVDGTNDNTHLAIGLYNLALCYARQGKKVELENLRREFPSLVESQEKVYGTMEERLRRDQLEEMALKAKESEVEDVGIESAHTAKKMHASRFRRLLQRLRV